MVKKQGKAGGQLPWGRLDQPATALCVPMHTGDIIGFKVGMSTGKNDKL
jgi:hypothetical protein